MIKNEEVLLEFLKQHYTAMPRTTLRYAIEKLDEPLRQDFLNGKFNMKTINFTAEIIQHGTDNAGYVVFPFSTEELFGKKGQVKVKVLFDNKVPYRGSLAKMGKSYHFLILTKEIRTSLNKTFEDTVEVSLQQDLEERVVIIPEEVLTIFNAYPEVGLAYNKLSYTRKKELMLWITSAKKEETRERRKQQLPSIILEETKNK